MTEKEIKKLQDFACLHGENAPVMVALRKEVCEALTCEPDNLVSTIVYDLQGDGVEITGIPSDMWSAIKSEHHRWYTDEESDLLPEDADDWEVDAVAYIQCDRIEDGFALTWKTWKQWRDAS